MSVTVDQNLKVGPVIGRVTDKSARILVELAEARVVTLKVVGPDGATVDTVKLDAPGKKPLVFKLDGLKASTRYTITVDAPNAIPGSFKTFAEAADLTNCKMAVVSCNKVYQQQYIFGGSIKEEVDLWKDIAARATELDVVCHIGDQVYADSDWYLIKKGKKTLAEAAGACKYAVAFELIKDLPADQWSSKAVEIRELYAQAWRETWTHPPTQALLANVCNLMIYDDHELRDDWGDSVADKKLDSPERFIVDIGYRVMLDYQHQLWEDIDTAGDITMVKDHFVEIYGKIGLLFMDVRGGKTFHLQSPEEEGPHPYLGTLQKKDIRDAYAGKFEKCKVLLVIVPIPIVYLSTKMNKKIAQKIDDFEGHFSVKEYQDVQREQLDLARMWKEKDPTRQVLFVGGDVHIGGHTAIYHNGNVFCEQLISSAIANKMVAKQEFLALMAVGELDEKLIGGYTFEHHDWKRERNYAIVDIHCGDDPSIAWRLVLGDDDKIFPDEQTVFKLDKNGDSWHSYRALGGHITTSVCCSIS